MITKSGASQPMININKSQTNLKHHFVAITSYNNLVFNDKFESLNYYILEFIYAV